MGRELTDEEAAELGLPPASSVERGTRIGMGDLKTAEDKLPAPANPPAGYVKTVDPSSDEAKVADLNTKRLGEEADSNIKIGMLRRLLAALGTGSSGVADEMVGAKAALTGGKYRDAQQAAEAEVTSAQKDYPIASAAGALPYLLVPGAQTVAGRLGTAGYVGGLGAAGDAPGGAGAAETVKDAGSGALTGLAIQGGLEVASPTLGKLAKLAKGKAEDFATKAVGNRGGIAERMGQLGYESPAQVRQLGRDILDEGLLDSGLRPWGPGKQEILERAGALKNQAGQSQRAALLQADLSGKPADFDEALWALAEPTLRAEPMTRAKAGRPVREMAKALMTKAEETPGSFQGLQDIKSDLMGNVDWRAQVPKAKALARQSVGSMGGNLTEQVGRAAGPQVASQLREANRLYGVGADVADLAADAGKREGANRSLGLAEQFGIGVGAGSGAGALSSMLGLSGPEAMVLGGAVGGGVQNFLRTRGPSTFAPGIDRAADAAAAMGEALPSLGPAVTASLTPEEEKRRRFLELLKGLKP